MEAFYFSYQILNKPLAEICLKYNVPTNIIYNDYDDENDEGIDPIGIEASTQNWDTIPQENEWPDNTLSEWISALIKSILDYGDNPAYTWELDVLEDSDFEDEDSNEDNWAEALAYIKNNKEEINNATESASYEVFANFGWPYNWHWAEHSNGTCRKVEVSGDYDDAFSEIEEEVVDNFDSAREYLLPLAEEEGLINEQPDNWTEQK